MESTIVHRCRCFLLHESKYVFERHVSGDDVCVGAGHCPACLGIFPCLQVLHLLSLRNRCVAHDRTHGCSLIGIHGWKEAWVNDNWRWKNLGRKRNLHFLALVVLLALPTQHETPVFHFKLVLVQHPIFEFIQLHVAIRNHYLVPDTVFLWIRRIGFFEDVFCFQDSIFIEGIFWELTWWWNFLFCARCEILRLVRLEGGVRVGSETHLPRSQYS